MKITINNQFIEIEYNTLLSMIMVGAIKQGTEIILETKTVIWKWNGKTNYSPINQVFEVVSTK